MHNFQNKECKSYSHNNNLFYCTCPQEPKEEHEVDCHLTYCKDEGQPCRGCTCNPQPPKELSGQCPHGCPWPHQKEHWHYKEQTPSQSAMEEPQGRWEERLFDISEKYCKHDDAELNSCLYYIFKPFIRTEIENARREGYDNGFENGRVTCTKEHFLFKKSIVAEALASYKKDLVEKVGALDEVVSEDGTETFLHKREVLSLINEPPKGI